MSVALRSTLRGLFIALVVAAPFGCDNVSTIMPPPSSSGGSPPAEEPSVCDTRSTEQCGNTCGANAPCPKGLKCSVGLCISDCDNGFLCPAEKPECQDDESCEDDDGGFVDPTPKCKTCAELGHACGEVVDNCGKAIDCAEEGLTCADDEMCVGGLDAPTECVPAGGVLECEVCGAIPKCDDEPQTTVLRGRVVSPGRNDDDTPNQVGIPNAVVYILRSTDLDELPEIATGLPEEGNSCDRCEEQDYGPVLTGAISDSTGHYQLEANIPVGVEFLMVVKAGKFRRATLFSLEDEAACATTDLSDTPASSNPTRLPRNMEDGLAVNIPRIAVATGELDAMECVFNKMGLDADQFGSPDSDSRIHLYRSNGAWPPDAACASCVTANGSTDIQTECEGCAECGGGMGNPSCNTCRNNVLATCQEPFDLDLLTGEDGTLTSYDLAVLDCEGTGWNQNSAFERSSERVREFVNRGGRLFASHLSFTWIHGDTDPDALASYDEENPLMTGLGPAATWVESAVSSPSSDPGRISVGRDSASPRIDSFAEWMVSEGIVDAPDESFNIVEPRSQVQSSETSNGLGPSSEEFIYCEGTSGGCANQRVQQFSFNTPYAAPDDAVCGRVAYSGFHVSVGSTPTRVFPSHCGSNDGFLTDQEKVLLYMLFDLGACVGDDPPPPPECVPVTCAANACGKGPDGCGGVLDCGKCEIP